MKENRGKIKNAGGIEVKRVKQMQKGKIMQKGAQGQGVNIGRMQEGGNYHIISKGRGGRWFSH